MWLWSEACQRYAFARDRFTEGLTGIANVQVFARSKGLTLIELVVVMTILVLLAFIATPSFIAVTKNAQVRTAAKQVVAILRYARSKAPSLGRPALVSFNRERRTVGVLLPSDVVERRLTIGAQFAELNAQIELTDEDLLRLSGERLENLDPQQFEFDPSPMGRERTLPEGVEIVSVRDLDSGEELNLVSFYPDGTSSGAEIVLANDKLAAVLEISPLTGSIQLNEVPTTDLRRQ